MKRAAAFVVLALAACGGDDGLGDASKYAEHCVTPRPAVDADGNKHADVQGTLLDELHWLEAWTDDLYLWYSEVPANDPSKYTDPLAYFDVLKTPAKTASGAAKDKFHFTYETSVWDALSGSGVEAGYGLEWALLKTSPPRELLVAYTTPNSPATGAGLVRGTKIISIDGVDVATGSDVDTLNNGISPATVGESHTFVVQDPGASTTHSVTMASASITTQPVQNVGLLALPAPNDKIGYIQFNAHIATAEQQLFDAITTLSGQGATDLVLDLRYNGGGYLDIAAELAYEIAGPAATTGKIFERETFNDKHPTTDPVTGETITPTPFYTTASTKAALPTLGLKRVYVLTGPGTCSASEAVMNGLAGVDVEVIQIGDTTCGKPYGFYPADNCGTTYFSIQFQGNNDKGFGDYPDGFVPGGVFKGCTVDDDFTKQLGDPTEGRLAAALYYKANGACPAAATSPANLAAALRRTADRRATGPDALRDPTPLWRANRIVRKR